MPGIVQQSADISSIIQELANQPGHTSSSPLTFIIEGSGKRVADSYDGNPQTAPGTRGYL